MKIGFEKCDTFPNIQLIGLVPNRILGNLKDYRLLKMLIDEKLKGGTFFHGYFTHHNRSNDTDCIVSNLLLYNDSLDKSSIYDIIKYLQSEHCNKLMDTIDGSDTSLHNLNHLIPFDINYSYFRYTNNTVFIQPCWYI